MKQLSFFIMMILGIVNTMAGVNATIDVDNASNIEVFYSDTFEEVSLTNGVNQLTLDESQGSQLAIFTSASDITFSEITLNGSPVEFEPKEAYVDISAGMNLVIRTQKEQSTTCDIYVDKIERVSIIQNAGYGQPLKVYDGYNTVEVSNIENPLKISATEGNELTNVLVNYEKITPLPDGTYRVELKPGDSLSIYSRVIPMTYSVSLKVNPEDYFDAISLRRNRVPMEVDPKSPRFDVEDNDRLLINIVKPGYEIEKVTLNGKEVEYDDYDEGYTIVINSTSEIEVFIKKTQAEEGYAFVNVTGNDPNVSIREFTPEGEFVRRFDAGRVYEVKIGNVLEIGKWTGAMFFRSVKCNGVELQPVSDRLYKVTVEGPTEIEVETYMKALVIGDSTPSEDYLSTAGTILLKGPGSDEPVRELYADAGDVITLVPQPGVGFVYEYAIRQGNPDVHYDTSYTVTEADVKNEIVAIEGVFKADTEHPALVLMANKVYDDSHKMIGYVKILYNNEEYDQVTVYEGDTVHLNCYVAEGYYCERFTLFFDNSVTLPQDYTVSKEDVNSAGVIDITAIVKEASGVDGVYDTAGSLLFNAEENCVCGSGLIKVITAAGAEVASGIGRVDVSTLASGIYMAVSETGSLKFIRR